jgi:murein L,D-transpeptidase YcbB/YkuD
MGLTPNGVIGKQVIDELNVLPNKRIQQILINLERMRWMPPQQNTAYILVNIPEYKMHVIHDGKQQFEMNVIVGTATHNTVIFSGKLQNIVFSPYWNVPSSIVASEIAPAMRRNKNYISNKNMEITGYSNGLPIVRQKPGKNNSLGLVKFLFPNSHSIYFHDTPNRNLFSETKRSFSHGCIRLAEPKKFAQYLLRADTATIWKSHIIDSVMNLTTEKWVTLKQPIPVLIAYFTAWVDVNGKLNFRKDIYKHDEKLAAKLFSAE